LIGFGLGGAAFHAPLIATTAGLTLTTIVTADPARRAQARQDYPGAQLASHATELWEHAAEHDLVVISTPNITHVPLAMAALSAGLPVVVDKPFAVTAAAARQVIEAAALRRLWVSVYHNRRWDSDYLTLRNLIERGQLGSIVRFESRLERWRPDPRGGWRERGEPAEGGGLLYDLGPHLIDQALQLSGPVDEVYAELDCRRAGQKTDDDLFLALTHRNGVRSHLWASYLAAQPGPRLRVLGRLGAFAIQNPDSQEAALRSGKRPGPGWGEEPRANWGTLNDGTRQTSIASLRGAYPFFYERIADTLRNGCAPPVDPLDAVAGLDIIEAAQRSAQRCQPIKLAAGQ
jgi:predicted dehydrogenase